MQIDYFAVVAHLHKFVRGPWLPSMSSANMVSGPMFVFFRQAVTSWYSHVVWPTVATQHADSPLAADAVAMDTEDAASVGFHRHHEHCMTPQSRE